MVDRPLLARKTASVRDHLARIAGLGAVSKEIFQSDPNRQDIILFRLERLLQDSLDIACHISADENWGTPDRYRDAFTFLGNHGGIDPELTRFLEDAAGFRDILVHGYEKINLERAFDLYERRDRFDDFCDAVLKFFAVTA